MLHDYRYSPTWDKSDVVEHLRRSRFARVIDIGGSMGGWSTDYITHYVDLIKKPDDPEQRIRPFFGSLGSFGLWAKVLEDVEAHGKFDFAICTHTLEDLANPALVCEMLPVIAKRGFIAVPSKYGELRRHEGPYLGWIHHRWIFDKHGERFIGYPKLTCLEHRDWTPLLATSTLGVRSELRFFWEESFELEIVNRDYMGPDVRSVLGYFDGLLGS